MRVQIVLCVETVTWDIAHAFAKILLDADIDPKAGIKVTRATTLKEGTRVNGIEFPETKPVESHGRPADFDLYPVDEDAL
jgi:hypothetical protein